MKAAVVGASIHPTCYLQSEMCAAAALADCLMHKLDGPQTFRRVIREDVRDALRDGNMTHAREFYATIGHFVTAHPEASGRAG